MKNYAWRSFVICAVLILTTTLAAESQTPTRVSFAKGKTWTTVTGSLKVGGVKTFLARGRSGQELRVETNNRKLAVNLRKGDADTTEDPGSLTAI